MHRKEHIHTDHDVLYDRKIAVTLVLMDDASVISCLKNAVKTQHEIMIGFCRTKTRMDIVTLK